MKRVARVLALAVAATIGAPAVDAADASVFERGRAAFVHRCAMCHREGGTGSNLIARRLGKDASLLEKRPDLQPEYLRHVVRWGYLNMPRISRVELPDVDLDAVIAYLAAKPQ